MTSILSVNQWQFFQVLLYAQLLQIPQAILQCKSFIDSKLLEQDIKSNKPQTFGDLYSPLTSLTHQQRPFSLIPSATVSSEKSSEATQKIEVEQKCEAAEADRILRPIASHGVPLIRFEESHPQVSLNWFKIRFKPVLSSLVKPIWDNLQ